ncbi:unnamed protein product [Caenorhabditis auriculariae]|uniref:Globin family profile domain-containing protein n=1 Tax=Caenorhabditis auriculariae TaxID=2777116 RepID=A0A8S1HN74_9PELO|nr:unnamed protein product [Caenorhabditis auriculariae]
MMRIKEAIQRKKLIHEMNEEFKDIDDALGSSLPVAPCPSPAQRRERLRNGQKSEDRLHDFVHYLSFKLSDLQKRALKVTWRRLSEAPKTSGRGTLHIMEKVLNMLCDKAPGVNSIFYKSAFLSCIEDRKSGVVRSGSIATIRDHAHILIKLIDDVLHVMFDGPLENAPYDPDMIGAAHCRLGPLGFDRSMWNVFGECFAEVMFMQECIRAYPQAPSAWSFFAVAMTDKMFASSKAVNSHSPLPVRTEIKVSKTVLGRVQSAAEVGRPPWRIQTKSDSTVSSDAVMQRFPANQITDKGESEKEQKPREGFEGTSRSIPSTPRLIHQVKTNHSADSACLLGEYTEVRETAIEAPTCPYSEVRHRQLRRLPSLLSKSEARIRYENSLKTTIV